MADADVLSDYFSVQTQNFFGQELTTALNDNLNFGYNVAENLTGSQDLIELRSRGKSSRPFTKVEEIRRGAQEKWMEKERELQEKFDKANARLSELQQGNEKERRVLDETYMNEVQKLRKDKIDARRELRNVQRHLREDIERLEAHVMFAEYPSDAIGRGFLRHSGGV